MELKKQICIIILIFLIASLFLVLFFVGPFFKDIVQKSEALISKRNSRLAFESQFTEAEKFKQKYESYKNNLDKMDSMLVDSENPIEFIKFLEQEASRLEINLQISPPSAQKDGSLNVIVLQVSTLGTFSNTVKFVNSLESKSYLIKVKNLNIAPNAQTPKQAGEVGGKILINVIAK